mmetsp:Transcript_90574/g.260957  ORF Transcript_90574/g.260957 Transcript_90574/m.260957 type:complete len:383 (+) Transcript_90574:468-1616(+)
MHVQARRGSRGAPRCESGRHTRRRLRVHGLALGCGLPFRRSGVCRAAVCGAHRAVRPRRCQPRRGRRGVPNRRGSAAVEPALRTRAPRGRGDARRLARCCGYRTPDAHLRACQGRGEPLRDGRERQVGHGHRSRTWGRASDHPAPRLHRELAKEPAPTPQDPGGAAADRGSERCQRRAGHGAQGEQEQGVEHGPWFRERPLGGGASLPLGGAVAVPADEQEQVLPDGNVHLSIGCAVLAGHVDRLGHRQQRHLGCPTTDHLDWLLRRVRRADHRLVEELHIHLFLLDGLDGRTVGAAGPLLSRQRVALVLREHRGHARGADGEAWRQSRPLHEAGEAFAFPAGHEGHAEPGHSQGDVRYPEPGFVHEGLRLDHHHGHGSADV